MSLIKYIYNTDDILTTPSVVDGYCPEDWISHGSNCYHFVKGSDLRTWNEADSYCVEQAGTGYNAHLASVHRYYVLLSIILKMCIKYCSYDWS